MPTEPNASDANVPVVATYRLQLTPDFGFDSARELLPFLKALGVTHVYTSPILQAAAGSTHGYDVIDHGKVSDALGGREAHERFVRAMLDLGLRQVADIVPNHMSIADRENVWWWDVLENGPSSRYASYFDVDWDPPERKNRNVVLMPILGDHRGQVLERRELKVVREGGRFVLRYYDHCLPVAPRSLDEVLLSAAERLASQRGWDEVASTLAFLADGFGELPHPASVDLESQVRRHRDKEVLFSLLRRLVDEQPAAAAAVDESLAKLNDDPAALDDFLDRQNFRIAYWRTAGQELDYRRFFDVNSLVGLRVEEDAVFDDTHRLIADWVRRGIVDGLRVDHIDGLLDPTRYLERLRSMAPRARILVEKIVEPGEELPTSWPVEGTTGYDFLNDAMGVCLDPEGEEPLTRLYREITGDERPFERIAREKRELVLREVLGSDVNRVVEILASICARRRAWRDFTRPDLVRLVRAVIASFPVYRAYVRPGTSQGKHKVSPQDERLVEKALARAAEERADLDPRLFDLMRDLLLARLPGHEEESFLLRFQQLTGPAMAKGVEDTAFYAYSRLVALNEVGGDPGCFGLSLQAFHAGNAAAQRRWPRRMLTTSTHDTKRSEDVRARLCLLSQMPDRWGPVVRRWCAMNARHKTTAGDQSWPDPDMELLYYQTLVGAWPLSVERAVAYMEKASREAKVFTSWTQPNAAYDEALKGFVERTLSDPSFLGEVEGFVAPLVQPGRATSLAWTLWKLTCPGAPDVYQGTELWSFDLVDPDNRRPVDWDRRRALLEEVAGRTPEQLLERADDGGPKLRLIQAGLALRARRPECFDERGAYRPMAARGPHEDEVVAYARGENVVAVAPRFAWRAKQGFEGTVLPLPRGTFVDVITGERHEGEAPVARLLGRFPVALLEADGGRG